MIRCGWPEAKELFFDSTIPVEDECCTGPK